MTVKEELHTLVDRLGDDQSSEALAFLQLLLQEGKAVHGKAVTSLAQRMQPQVKSGRDFFSQPTPDLEALAAQQGVKPVTAFDALLGDFWPEEETADEFIAAVRQWRREDSNA